MNILAREKIILQAKQSIHDTKCLGAEIYCLINQSGLNLIFQGNQTLAYYLYNQGPSCGRVSQADRCVVCISCVYYLCVSAVWFAFCVKMMFGEIVRGEQRGGSVR